MNESIYDVLSNKTEREERKKKLHSLLDKYNGSVEALEDAVGADEYEYMFAKPYLDEVLAERRATSERSAAQIKRGRNEFEEEMYEQGYERNKKTNSDKGSLLMKLLPNSIGLAKRQADRLAKVSMSDENKHQYVSCVGAQGGVPEAAIMLAAGLYKELKDLYNKLPSEEQRRRYHGVAEILKDSAKDLKNDLYGVAYGLGYKKEGDCDILLRKKIK